MLIYTTCFTQIKGLKVYEIVEIVDFKQIIVVILTIHVCMGIMNIIFQNLQKYKKIYNLLEITKYEVEIHSAYRIYL